MSVASAAFICQKELQSTKRSKRRAVWKPCAWMHSYIQAHGLTVSEVNSF